MKGNLSFREALKKGAVIYNPVLVQLVGLCPVVAASTTFQQAAMLSAAMCIELIATCVIASALLKNLPRWIRVPVYFLIGLAFVCPALYYFETYSLSSMSLGLKIYLPLTAINSVVAVHCEQFAVKNSVKNAFLDAVASGIGVSAIFLITGAVREILGKATFAGVSINLPVTLKGMALPFGCIILLGYLAALLNSVTAKTYPHTEESEETTETENEAITETEAEVTVIQKTEAEPETVTVQATEEKSVDDIIESATADLDEFLRSLGIDIPAEEDSAQ
ncbi:MAG: hypothetical protein IKB88_07610 [Clostridia bacterium]|nr:hypothetical protein [Clostridia bacterium]